MRSFLVIFLIGFAASGLVAQRTPAQPVSATQIAPSKQSATPPPSKRNKRQTGAADRSGQSTSTAKNNVYPAPSTNPQNPAAAQTNNNAATARSGANTPPPTAPALKPTAAPAVPGSKTAPATTTAEAAKPLKVNWISFEEALEKCKTEKRKIFIDVYTDWCGWCKRMDETTFADPRVVDYLNKNYYPVKFNAEQQQDIVFKDKTYHYKKVGNSRGYHELAAELLNNRLSFPTTVFLDEELNLIQPLPGYLDAPKFETIITYFGTDNHKKTPWETYEKNFASMRQR